MALTKGNTCWVEHVPPGILDEFSKTPSDLPVSRTYLTEGWLSNSTQKKNRCITLFFSWTVVFAERDSQSLKNVINPGDDDCILGKG